jgi:hypothetical protein
MLAGAPSTHPSLLFPSLSFPSFLSQVVLMCFLILGCCSVSFSPPTFFFWAVFLELGFACMRLLVYFTASLGFLLDDGWVGSSFLLKNQDLMSRSIIF